MAMGIDQEIQRRMDAYRGNPQALQQRYQMNQQLLDLLALQKLKSEKDAVARQMQAQMQQVPSTVAQQREQELLGRTKQEMAQQVGGVMQQQARQQQQNMARMAQAAARPQGGIAGLAPQGARMAGGGIVAFQEGGALSEEERRRREMLFFERALANDPLLQRMEAVIRSRAENRPVRDRFGERSFESASGDSSEIRNYLPLPSAAAPAPTATAGMAGVDDREGPPNFPPGPDSGGRGRDMGGLGVLLAGETMESGSQPKRAGDGSVIAGVRDITAPAIPEKSSRTEEIESGIATLRKQGDPMGQLRGLTEFTDQYLRRGDIRKAGEERARRLAELDRAQMDPEALRRERLMAALIGAAGKSTFGLTGAGAAAGAENARQQQRIAERQRLIDQMDLERELRRRTSSWRRKAWLQVRWATNRLRSTAVRQKILPCALGQTRLGGSCRTPRPS